MWNRQRGEEVHGRKPSGSLYRDEREAALAALSWRSGLRGLNELHADRPFDQLDLLAIVRLNE